VSFLSAIHILWTSRLRVSSDDRRSQRCWITRIIAAVNTAKLVNAKMMINRGGNDFFSGQLGGSITLTLGTDFASSILTSSYCSVKRSYTVSFTFTWR